MGSTYDPGVETTYRLTNRQKQILELVACGLAGKEIAASLGIKHQTVKNHCLAIRRALGASNNSHAVRLGIEQHLIDICQDEVQDAASD